MNTERAALMGLTPMARVDVVVQGADAALVRGLFTAAGVSGVTVMSNVSGLGHAGWHEGRLPFNDTDALVLMFAVVDDDTAERVVASLRELLEHRPGVMLVSEVAVSRPAYFRVPGDAVASAAADHS